MALRRTLLACSALALVLGLAGCAAEKGDPCKEDNDCSGGLMCCKPTTMSPSARGTCLPSCEMVDEDAGPADSGPGDSGPGDAGPTDAATDAQADAASDAGPMDGGSDAGSDAGTDSGADSGPEDAGSDV